MVRLPPGNCSTGPAGPEWRILTSSSAQLAAEESRDSVRRWALVPAGLLLAIWTTITAEPRAAHHLLREREYEFRQFRIEVVRLSGRYGEVPGVDEKVTCPQLEECGTGNVSDGYLVGAGKALGFSEGLLRRPGRGAMGGFEVFGEWSHLASGSLYDSPVTRDDVLDEGLHIPIRTWRR
jgi:hypothetical protein